MEFIKDVETNNVSLRLRKPFTSANMSSHSILTEDIFSYVDFFFKTHKKVLKDNSGKKVEQDHSFYWEQAKNFYNASKVLPIESAPLPMYYSMLNAAKAYVYYNAESYEIIKNDFKGHGLHEGTTEAEGHAIKLDTIYIKRDGWGVFTKFASMLEKDFGDKWKCKDAGAISIKDLLYQLPYVHSAYISTYSLPRKREKFIPLVSGSTPTFKYGKDKKIRLVVDLDKSYFKQGSTMLPDEVKQSLPTCFELNNGNCFQLVSKESFKKNELPSAYHKYRKHFSYIAADKRIWYLTREPSSGNYCNLNSMVVAIAAVHRFSEIVRYKPEQMVRLLKGKENWLIHEFLSIALDQFIDELACEITKEEIMPTRTK